MGPPLRSTLCPLVYDQDPPAGSSLVHYQDPDRADGRTRHSPSSPITCLCATRGWAGVETTAAGAGAGSAGGAAGAARAEAATCSASAAATTTA
jgi:hypothetical protein